MGTIIRAILELFRLVFEIFATVFGLYQMYKYYERDDIKNLIVWSVVVITGYTYLVSVCKTF